MEGFVRIDKKLVKLLLVKNRIRYCEPCASWQSNLPDKL